MNFQTWQGSFEFDLIINPNLPSHKSNESELAWTCLGELRSKALSFPQKPFSFFARTGCCCNRASLLFTQPPFLVMKSLYSDSGGPPSAPVLSIQCAAQLIPALFYEWFMETRRTLRLSTFSLFQTVVQREWYFSCQWEPERPDGLFWQGSMSVKGPPSRPRSKRKHKCAFALTSTGNHGKNILTWFYSSLSRQHNASARPVVRNALA